MCALVTTIGLKRLENPKPAQEEVRIVSPPIAILFQVLLGEFLCWGKRWHIVVVVLFGFDVHGIYCSGLSKNMPS